MEASDGDLFTKQMIEAAIRLGIVLLLGIWCFLIVAPFIAPILWAIILAIGSHPLYCGLRDRLRLSDGLGATVFTLLMLALLITPTVMLASALLENAQSLSADLSDGSLTIPPPPEGVQDWPLVGPDVARFWAQASADPQGTLGQLEPQLQKVGRWLIATGAGTGLGVLIFSFSIIIAGVFLARAKGAGQAVRTIATRLAGDRGDALVELGHSTVQSVVRGILGIALVQALLAGLGFLAMGVPGAGVLAVICLILAVVQIDILLVLIPLSIYAFTVASTPAAVAFLVWNIFVGLLNNVLKPILLGRGVDAPMAVIFVGAIGGLMLSGIIGLFVGAVVLVLGYTLFMEWLKTDSAAGVDERSV